MEKIDEIISKRRKIAKFYDENLSDLDMLRIPVVLKGYRHIYQMYSILIKEGRKTRNKLQDYLEKKGITTKVYFEPAHKTSFYEKVLRYNLKLETTEKISGATLSLPIYPDLSLKEQNYIVRQIKKFYNMES